MREKKIEVTDVEPQKAGERSSEIVEADQNAVCYWNGQQYSHGASICNNNRNLVCMNGQWFQIGGC